MAGETWPASLPQYPRKSGYVRKPGDSRVVTPMQQGSPRARRLYSNVPAKFNVTYIMALSQWATFENFWDVTLNGGVKTIDLPLKTPTGNQVVEVLVLKRGDEVPVGTDAVRFTLQVIES